MKKEKERKIKTDWRLAFLFGKDSNKVHIAAECSFTVQNGANFHAYLILFNLISLDSTINYEAKHCDSTKSHTLS